MRTVRHACFALYGSSSYSTTWIVCSLRQQQQMRESGISKETIWELGYGAPIKNLTSVGDDPESLCHETEVVFHKLCSNE